MNENQAKGTAKEIGGKVERKWGEVTDNKSAEIKGGAREAEGKVQKGAGDIERKVDNAADRANRKVHNAADHANREVDSANRQTK